MIPKPKENARTVLVLKPDPDLPSIVIKGVGNLNLLCGYCEYVLCEKVGIGHIRNVVLKCPVCNNYNDIR